MKWINPRIQLPKPGQLIWLLKLENRKGDRCGDPAAEIVIAQAEIDRFGVMFAEIISHKGYPQYIRHFYEWWHAYQEKEKGEETFYRSHREDEIITAWMPFEDSDIPEWNFIGIEESKEIIKASPVYQKSYKDEITRREIEKATKVSPYFINCNEHMPPEKGLYVVIVLEGCYLQYYENEKEGEWLALNGKPVLAWYPVPNHWQKPKEA